MKRYTLTYRDRLNNQHVAYIDIVSGSGSVTIENGDVSPLVIEEDYNDDMLSPIRTKTGYLRVVEPIFGQYADLYPTIADQSYCENHRRIRKATCNHSRSLTTGMRGQEY